VRHAIGDDEGVRPLRVDLDLADQRADDPRVTLGQRRIPLGTASVLT